MNILAMKRQQYIDELAKLTTAKNADIAEKVAAYKLSLEAQEDKKITAVRLAIDAIDVLLNNKGADFEYELVEDEVYEADIEEEVETEEVETEEAEAEQADEIIQEVSDDSELAECFKRKNLARPGMNTISVPARH